MILATATIAKEDLKSPLNIPHITYTQGYIDRDWNNLDGYRGKTRERVQYLAKRRNGAVAAVLRKFPDTTHILMIDSYYLRQRLELRAFIQDYAKWDVLRRKLIMGASTWFQSYLWPHQKWVFWDSWTTPELRLLKRNENRMLMVKAVGGIIIFPVQAWLENLFDDSAFPDGCEMNGFCNKAGLPVVMNTYRKFYHPNPKRYSFVKSARVRAGFWKRKLFQ